MCPVEKMKRGRVGVHCTNSVENFCSCQMSMEGEMTGCKELACVMDVPERAVHELDYVWLCALYK